MDLVILLMRVGSLLLVLLAAWPEVCFRFQNLAPRPTHHLTIGPSLNVKNMTAHVALHKMVLCARFYSVRASTL